MMMSSLLASPSGSVLELRLDFKTLISKRRLRHRQQWLTVRSSLAPRDSSPPSEGVKWSDDARTAVTDAVIRGFLASTAKEATGQTRPKGGAAGATKNGKLKPDHKPPNSSNGNIYGTSTAKEGVGAQGQIVGHLLAGNFDEQILAAAPTTTLNWSIKTLGKQGRLDIAEQLFHWMRIRNVANEHSFVKLCEACEAQRSPWKALLTWRNVRRLPASFILGERSVAALLKTYRKVGDLPGAVRILDEFSTSKTVSLNQYAFNVVIRCAADQGDIATALAVAEKLRTHPTSQCDARTFSALLSAVVASQRWSRTAAVHKLLQEEGVVPDATLYLQLIACYAGAGRPEAAEAVLDSMIDEGLRPGRVHWNALLSSYAEARRYEGCASAYERMTQVAGIRPDAYTMVALLHGAAGARGGVTAASWVMGLMQQHEIAMNIEIGTALIACCRHSPPGQERRRSVEFSHGVLSILQSAGVAPNIKTYNSLMAVQFDAQDYVGVRETMDALELSADVEPTEATFNIALGAFQAAGFYDKVQEIENLRETWRTLHGRTQTHAFQTINKSVRCAVQSGATRPHIYSFGARSPKPSLSPSLLQHQNSSRKPRCAVIPLSSAAGDLHETNEPTTSISSIEPRESWHHLIHGAASWLAAYKPPRYLWRTLAALVLGGEVMVRILQGKIHLRNTMDQLNLVGPRSLGVCLLTAAFVGMVFTIQFIREFAKLGLTRSVGGVLALALARELTPVVTSIILAGRVGSAFAAELGTMQVSEQTDSLRVLGSDPVDYLITPRVLACMVAGPILNLLCFCMGMAASVFLADAVYDVPANVILDSACRAIDAWDIVTSMIKCWVFGTIISVVSCSWGYTTAGGAKGVGESTTSAVVISLVLIFVFDFALSFLFFQGQGDALKSCM